MAIRAVVFDIGGVLEITPDTGIPWRWESRLGLPAGKLNERLGDVWAAGSIGTITEDEVHQAIEDRLGLDEQDRAAFMSDQRIYALVCSRLKAQPEETVFVDDTDRCIAGAREAGIHAIRYRDDAQVVGEIEHLLTGGHPARVVGGP